MITDSRLSLDKIGEMRVITDMMKETAASIDVASLQKASNAIVKKCDDTHRTLAVQQRSLQTFFSDITKEIKSQNVKTENALIAGQKHVDMVSAAIQAGPGQVELAKNFKSIYNNQTNILQTVVGANKATESKVEEVLRVLSGLQTAAASRRDKELAILRTLDGSFVDKIESVLDEHEARTRGVIMMTSTTVMVVAAAITSVVLYAFGKLS